MPTGLLNSLSAIASVVIAAAANITANITGNIVGNFTATDNNITATKNVVSDGNLSDIVGNITAAVNVVGNRSTVCFVDGDFTPIYLPSVYSISLIVGVAGNGAGIYCFCRHVRPWSPLTVYMLNLAASDLCYVLSLPFLIDYYVARTWRYPEWHCKAQRLVFHANMYASILFLTVIAVHRYAGIVHPMRCRGAPLAVSRRASALVSAGVWAAVVAMVLPQARFVKLGTARGGGGGSIVKCYDTADREMLGEYLPYSAILSVLGFFGPFCAMLFCYGSVVRALARSSGAAAGGPRGGLPGGEARAISAADHTRTLRIVALTLVLFAFCFLPYHVMRLWNLVVRLHPPKHCSTSTNVYITYQVTRGLACLNSCLDPILYVFARGGVRSALRESLRSVSRSELTRLSLRHLDRISALGSGWGASGGAGGAASEPVTGVRPAGSLGVTELDGLWTGCSGKSTENGGEDFDDVFEEAAEKLPHR